MVFDIYFTTEETEGSTIGNSGLIGEIVLGDTYERFTSFIGFWSPADYARQWRDGVRRIIEKHNSSCLLTSINHFAAEEMLAWWLMYPDGEAVVFQEALLSPERYPNDTSYSAFYERTPERAVGRRATELAPSEWTVNWSDLMEYLSRRS